MIKKSLPLLLLCLINIGICAQTTTEEYEYATRGYMLHETAGMDMKAGYHIEQGYFMSVGTIDINALYMVRSTGETACIILKHSKAGNATKYLCIPHHKSSVGILTLCYTDYTTAFPVSTWSSSLSAQVQFLYEMLVRTVGTVKIK